MVQRQKTAQCGFSRLPSLANRNAHQNREHNNLRHIAIRHRLDGVGRENANRHFFEGGGNCRGIARRNRGINTCTRINNVGESFWIAC